MIRKPWWKWLSFILLLYTCIAGFFVKIPVLDDRLQQSIRNLFFHVPMWMSMTILFIISAVYAVKYLSSQNPIHDYYSLEYARTGCVFAALGFVTGMIWANYQWGAPWSGDPKQIYAVIGILIYFAYFILRSSMTDIDKRSKVSAVYNIFAFCMSIPLIYILPRLKESLHPGGQGSEGNPGLNPNDLDANMRLVFYPAIIGWTLLGAWITTLRIRFRIYQEKQLLLHEQA